MARCSRSAQQCLTSAAGFDFARFAAAWVWRSCQTVFVWFSVFNVFLLNMFLAFFIMIYMFIKNMFILFWQVVVEKYWILKSVCLEIWAPARARGRCTIFPQTLCVCEKEEGQSNYTQVDRSCEFHSWTLGTSNTCFFPAEFWKLQSVCAHVIPLGPAFIISYIWFSVFCHLPCHILSSQSSFFLLGVSRLLVGTLGRSLFLTAGVCNGVRKMKNPVKFLRKLSQLTKREKLFSTT